MCKQIQIRVNRFRAQTYTQRFLVTNSDKFIRQMQAGNKMIKKRGEEIKNTKIYPNSPFLKGYVQSFTN